MRGSGSRARRAVAGLALMVLLVPPALAREYVDAIQSETEIPEARLLDVGIQVFDPGLPQPDPRALEDDGVYPGLRRAESRYIPFRLKNTLQSTGYWGAVRVVPTGTESTDLIITGRIVESSGFRMELAIRAVDSRGKVWRDRTYKQEADPESYAPERLETRDPYQALYNEIANDLVKVLQKRKEREIDEIRTITRLRFGADLAPVAFEDYLKVKGNGRYRIQRLPADGDPMLARIAKVRERDYMFIDTLNEYYADFYAHMDSPYYDWRQYSYEEELALREIRRQARLRKALGALLILGGIAAASSSSTGGLTDAAVIGGALVVKSGVDKGKESKIHRAAIQELAASFDSEVTPMVVEVEGHTLKLEGSAEAQFDEWRHLLHDIFVEETGLPGTTDAVSTAH